MISQATACLSKELATNLEIDHSQFLSWRRIYPIKGKEGTMNVMAWRKEFHHVLCL